MGWKLSPDRYNSNCQEESWCLLHQKRDFYGVFYTIQSTFPIINIHDDCRDRKEVFSHESKMSMPKKKVIACRTNVGSHCQS